MAHLFCPDDVVVSKEHGWKLGAIERTPGDVTTHEPDPEMILGHSILRDDSIPKKSFRRFLVDGVPPQGTLLVRWVCPAYWELTKESKLELRDRTLLMADVVRKGAQSAMSGVVLNSLTSCTLQQMCTAYLPNGKVVFALPRSEEDDFGLDLPRDLRTPRLYNVPLSELKQAEPLMENELVIYGAWVGRVMTVVRALALRLSDNTVVEVSEDEVGDPETLPDGYVAGDIVTTKKGTLRRGRWIYGQYNPNTTPVGTVVDVRVIRAEIHWLHNSLYAGTNEPEPPEVFERDGLESPHFMIYDRTRRPASDAGVNTISYAEPNIGLGSRVQFKDLASAALKYTDSSEHGGLTRISRQDTLGYDLNVYDIHSTSTSVMVQWQDCSITRERSIDLMPIAEPNFDDEHAAWPTQISHSLEATPLDGNAYITQPTRVGVIQTVDAAQRLATIKWCPYGKLYYSEAGEGDGPEPAPKVLVSTAIGTASGDSEQVSLYDLKTPESLFARRGDIALITHPVDTGEAVTSDGPSWLGEVVDILLDGTLRVRLGAAAQVRDIIVRREEITVAVRWDDLNGSLEDELAVNDEGFGSESDDLMEDIGTDTRWMDENGNEVDDDEVGGSEWESEDDDEAMPDAPPQQAPATSDSATSQAPDNTQVSTPETQARPRNTGSSSVCDAYKIYETPVESDHRYHGTQPSNSPMRNKRIQKEHTILQKRGAIPDGVFVRTWESRLDLLRVLIIGPEDTPYQHAPFVIDFHLPDAYPQSPPEAYFHSWPGESGLGGSGRVNPNLYQDFEDGKICLSLLGTWSGEAGESWSASSTLLQVIVSLLGLVLVKEPYFNEAGYETRAGLEESKVPSMIYSERAGIRAKSFVISAVSAVLRNEPLVGIGGMRNDIRKLYLNAEGAGLLEKVAQDVQTVLQRSQAEGAQMDGLSVVSQGACIPLGRVAKRLEELRREYA